MNESEVGNGPAAASDSDSEPAQLQSLLPTEGRGIGCDILPDYDEHGTQGAIWLDNDLNMHIAIKSRVKERVDLVLMPADAYGLYQVIHQIVAKLNELAKQREQKKLIIPGPGYRPDRGHN